MKQKNIISIWDTPRGNKMCPLAIAFQAATDSFETIVCVTGQHRKC